MDKIIAIFCFFTTVGVMIVAFPDSIPAVLVLLATATLAVVIIRQATDENEFLIRIFLIALLARIIFGTFVYVFKWGDFFGGDTITYDALGQRLVEIWFNNASTTDAWSQRAMSTSGPGWGINYLTGFIYAIVGRNVLAAQYFCAVVGAASAPMVYVCAHKIFHNQRVGKIAAILVALFPSFIIWSSQLLKDGLIIFLLVVAMTMVLHLQERMNYLAIGVLILSLIGILSLRFYIFYMVAIAVAGSFIVGQSDSVKSIVQRLVVLVFLGLALTYLGVLRTAGESFDKYATFDRLQASRSDLANSAESGFGRDIDVSTTEGALSVIPLGFTYLMLAPFPWQMTNLRQLITLPEVLVWWSAIPLLLFGLWYTIKHRLRGAIPILIFTLMLTIAYSVFQGNVGTAYRQRTQIQVFLFIFIAVGWTLFQEKKENKKLQRLARQRELDNHIRKVRS